MTGRASRLVKEREKPRLGLAIKDREQLIRLGVNRPDKNVVGPLAPLADSSHEGTVRLVRRQAQASGSVLSRLR
jgi:hypothetical protein